MSATVNEEIKERIEAARKDRDKLQDNLDEILSKPFFKRHKDDDMRQELDNINSEIDQKTQQISEDARVIDK
jgi:uncharacterized membrane protein